MISGEMLAPNLVNSYKRTKMGSDLSPDWPFTDPKWIKPPAKIRAHFRPHKDRTFYRIYQSAPRPIPRHLPTHTSSQLDASPT
jgi:hypothetical protein